MTRTMLPLLLCCLAACQEAPLPDLLWVYYSQREVDLALVDYEPPPF